MFGLLLDKLTEWIQFNKARKKSKNSFLFEFLNKIPLLHFFFFEDLFIVIHFQDPIFKENEVRIRIQHPLKTLYREVYTPIFNQEILIYVGNQLFFHES